MNTNSISSDRYRSIANLAFPIGFAAACITTLIFLQGDKQGVAEGTTTIASPLLQDLLVFVQTGIRQDPLLVCFAVGMFVFYVIASQVARSKQQPTGRLLSLFKATGFAASLALVAAKLPAVLLEHFPAAAAIAPMYQPIGFFTFAIVGACLLELVIETIKVVKAHKSSKP